MTYIPLSGCTKARISQPLWVIFSGLIMQGMAFPFGTVIVQESRYDSTRPMQKGRKITLSLGKKTRKISDGYLDCPAIHRVMWYERSLRTKKESKKIKTQS